MRCTIFLLVGLVTCTSSTIPAQEPASRDAQTHEPDDGRFNLRLKTAGGTQLWTDFRHQQGWLIQQNSLTDHYRLLSPEGKREAWGTWQECSTKFEAIKKEKQLQPVTGKIVILLHGLGRSRGSMKPLAKYLEDNSEFEAINFGYASTRKSVQDHSAALAKVIEGLPQATEISFVCHSLGNIVVRNYLHTITDKDTGRISEPRLKRMVMLGPPNNGAQLARRFDGLGLFKAALGESAVQLADDWETLEPKLAVPSFEFGIVAGRVGANPLIDGDDDLVVAVEETKLPGATDFRVVECAHTTLMNNKQVREMLNRFLKNGWFEAADRVQPLR